MASADDPTRRAGGLPQTIADGARAVLSCPEPSAKAEKAARLAGLVAAGDVTAIGTPGAPAKPARPSHLRELAPKHMPRRRAAGSRAGRIALYHALAHIELNAVDLACDLVARFADPALPAAFYADWVRIAAEEAHHFELLDGRLGAFGAAYGELPVHGGLWEAAANTGDDLLARLAVVPLVLEARGLDVTPDMIARLKRFGDDQGAAVLELILNEEIGHVACGWRWFRWLADRRGLDAPSAWARLVRTRFKGDIKPPFNEAARAAAGFAVDWSALATGVGDGGPRR